MSWPGPPPQYTPVAYPAIPGNKPVISPQYFVEHPRLHIVAATWGGIVVTPDVQAMISANQTVTLDVNTLVHYENSSEGLCLLSTSEEGPSITIRPTAHQAPPLLRGWQNLWEPAIYPLGATWRAAADGVEILAVIWGGQRIQTPTVLAELAKYFEGQRGQIRMTNAFFRCDPWINHKKTWTVYFRFPGSERVQVVTGIEDGALEVPWGRVSWSIRSIETEFLEVTWAPRAQRKVWRRTRGRLRKRGEFKLTANFNRQLESHESETEDADFDENIQCLGFLEPVMSIVFTDVKVAERRNQERS
ncbi:hypothetical protein B0H12DRAFT_1072156 [Mycena haematopus]|nr:hypothetical protein B0H12DRAFT_1072156 [Mycena haematopus]